MGAFLFGGCLVDVTRSDQKTRPKTSKTELVKLMVFSTGYSAIFRTHIFALASGLFRESKCTWWKRREQVRVVEDVVLQSESQKMTLKLMVKRERPPSKHVCCWQGE